MVNGHFIIFFFGELMAFYALLMGYASSLTATEQIFFIYFLKDVIVFSVISKQ